MPDLPTRLDYYSLGRAYLIGRSQKIDPSVVDVQGSDANIVVGGSSVLADAVTKQIGYRTAALTLDGADNEDLDRYVWDRYQEVRKGASAAVGSVRFFRTSFVAGGGSVPVGTLLKTLAGTQYKTTTTANFGSTDLVSTADVVAVQAGKVTQAGKNTIRAFADPSSIFDSTLQVTNDLTTAGGEDAEDDDTFKNRIRTFWANVRRGVLSAIVQGATSVPGVVSAQAIEALNSAGQPARVVNLYISDSSGVASAALGNLVEVALLDYRAAGIQVIVNTSIPLIVQVVLALTFAAGVDTVTLSENIRAAVVEFVNSLPVNGPLYLADLYTVLKRFAADGLVVTQSSIVSPTGDLDPAVNQTLRTTDADVTLAAA